MNRSMITIENVSIKINVKGDSVCTQFAQMSGNFYICLFSYNANGHCQKFRAVHFFLLFVLFNLTKSFFNVCFVELRNRFNPNLWPHWKISKMNMNIFLNAGQKDRHFYQWDHEWAGIVKKNKIPFWNLTMIQST